MTDLMVIAISVAASLIADIVIDCGLLIRKGVGSKEYRNALKFAKNNKDIIDQQDIIKNMYGKITQLESQIKSFPRSSHIKSSDISLLESEIQKIKEALKNSQHSNGSNDESIISAIKGLALRISQLEKGSDDVVLTSNFDYERIENAISKLNGEITSLKTEIYNLALLKDRVYGIENSLKNLSNEMRSISDNSSALERKISVLKSEIITLKSNINTVETNTQLEHLVRQLSGEVIKLKSVVSSQQEIIDSLNSKTPATNNTSIPKPPIETKKPSVSINVPAYIITPDEDYVRTLLSRLSDIKAFLGNWEFKNYEDGLKKLLNEGDFDDGEEIMGSVHELIKKFIYGSDTKVSASDWEKLEKYIINAGYTPVPVKSGDDISPYKSYFDRPIPANGGTPNTIKQIQLKPFILTYEDYGEKETIKLCGKCTYYK